MEDPEAFIPESFAADFFSEVLDLTPFLGDLNLEDEAVAAENQQGQQNQLHHMYTAIRRVNRPLAARIRAAAAAVGPAQGGAAPHQPPVPNLFPPSIGRPQLRPISNLPRTATTANEGCADGKAFNDPNCFYPYSQPLRFAGDGDGLNVVMPIKWNRMHYDPTKSSATHSPEFVALDAYDKAAMHLARARTQAATASGFWRKYSPFVSIPTAAMVVEERRARALFGYTDERMDEIERMYQRVMVDDEFQGLFMPNVMGWASTGFRRTGARRQRQENDEGEEEETDVNADDFLRDQYVWQRAEGSLVPDVSADTWRSGSGVAVGVSDTQYRKYYAQGWGAAERALSHVYEALRLVRERADALAPNVPDERLQRVPLLPEDFDVLIYALGHFSTDLALPSTTAARHSMFDGTRGRRDIVARIQQPEAEVVSLHTEDGQELGVFSVPALSIAGILARLIAAPRDKKRSARIETLRSDDFADKRGNLLSCMHGYRTDLAMYLDGVYAPSCMTGPLAAFYDTSKALPPVPDIVVVAVNEQQPQPQPQQQQQQPATLNQAYYNSFGAPGQVTDVDLVNTPVLVQAFRQMLVKVQRKTADVRTMPFMFNTVKEGAAYLYMMPVVERMEEQEREFATLFIILDEGVYDTDARRKELYTSTVLLTGQEMMEPYSFDDLAKIVAGNTEDTARRIRDTAVDAARWWTERHPQYAVKLFANCALVPAMLKISYEMEEQQQ